LKPTGFKNDSASFKLSTPRKIELKKMHRMETNSENSKLKKDASDFGATTGPFGTRRFLTGPRLQPMYDPGAIIMP
jgi:hypothetical protein